MATSQVFVDTQQLGETRKYSADLSAFIPTGASLASASGSYAFRAGLPSGSVAATTSGGSVLTLTLAAGSAWSTGMVYLDGFGTLSNSELRQVRWVLHVEF